MVLPSTNASKHAFEADEDDDVEDEVEERLRSDKFKSKQTPLAYLTNLHLETLYV